MKVYNQPCCKKSQVLITHQKPLKNDREIETSLGSAKVQCWIVASNLLKIYKWTKQIVNCLIMYVY